MPELRLTVREEADRASALLAVLAELCTKPEEATLLTNVCPRSSGDKLERVRSLIVSPS